MSLQQRELFTNYTRFPFNSGKSGNLSSDKYKGIYLTVISDAIVLKGCLFFQPSPIPLLK